MGLFAVVLVLLCAREARFTTERGMRDTARALALAIDRYAHTPTAGEPEVL
jgi:hypothetical protein